MPPKGARVEVVRRDSPIRRAPRVLFGSLAVAAVSFICFLAYRSAMGLYAAAVVSRQCLVFASASYIDLSYK